MLLLSWLIYFFHLSTHYTSFIPQCIQENTFHSKIPLIQPPDVSFDRKPITTLDPWTCSQYLRQKSILNACAYKPSQLEAPFQERAPFGEREILNLSIPYDTCYLCVLTIIRVLNIREFTKLYFTYNRAVVKRSLQKEGRRVVMRTAGKNPSPSIKKVLVLSFVPREETPYMTKGKVQRSLCC